MISAWYLLIFFVIIGIGVISGIVYIIKKGLFRIYK